MSDFPRMLYQNGGPHEIHGGMFDHKIVEHEDELQAALADGWFITTCEARAPRVAASEPVPESVPVVPADDAAPTRAEMERKAAELGILFDGRTRDAKLAEKIAEAMKG